MNQAAQNLHVEEVQQTRYNPKKSAQVQAKPQPKRKAITKGEKLLWALGVAVIMAMAIAIISTQTAIYSTSGKIQNMENKIESVEQTNHQLHVQVTKLSEPQRIIRIAREKLGLELNADQVKVLP